MARRLEFQAALEALLGSENVYFQPPNGLQMAYPCIVYEINDEVTNYANNRPFKAVQRYSVTSIDRNPDSAIPDKLRQMTNSRFSRAFNSDGLHHVVYNIHF